MPYDLATLAEGIKRANAAGNVEAVKKLGMAYRRLQSQQQAAPVDSRPPEGAQPGSRAYADWAAQQARAGQAVPQVSDPNFGPHGLMDQIAAGTSAAYNAVPIAGPSLLKGIEGIRGSIQGMAPDQVSAETKATEAANPAAATAGAITGTVLPFAVGGAIPGVAKVLGMAPEASLLANSLWSAGSSAAISGADSLARGSNPMQAAQDAGIGGVLGGLIPGAGAVLKGGLRAIPKVADWSLGGLPSTMRQSLNTERSAQKAVGRAVQSDATHGLTMDATEDAAATANGLDVRNIDRGGPATRRLARVASSSSPEAKAALEDATSRGAPGTQTAEFLTRLVGGSADDLALRDGLERSARLTNAPAYAKAEAHPAAQSIFTPEIQQLMYAPEFMQAVKEAESSGKTWAARFGGKPVQSPFVFAADGTVSMRPGVTPNLKFWDQVQRNLRAQAEALSPMEKTKSAALKDLRGQLLGVLDSAVPDFKTARQGAASFFGAENAIDAGRQFALQPRNLPEALKAIGGMSAVDKKAFSIGAASSAVDKLKADPRGTYEVVKSTFGSPAAKEFWNAVVGPHKAKELESFVQVQGIMNESKNAIKGGSQTYDLMVAGGLGAAGGAGSYFAPGNNFSSAAYFIALARLGRSAIGKHVDATVAGKIAELLASGDKAALNKVVFNASMSPRWKEALDAISYGMMAATRGAAQGRTNINGASGPTRVPALAQ